LPEAHILATDPRKFSVRIFDLSEQSGVDLFNEANSSWDMDDMASNPVPDNRRVAEIRAVK
jgi:hypothetical protein